VLALLFAVFFLSQYINKVSLFYIGLNITQFTTVLVALYSITLIFNLKIRLDKYFLVSIFAVLSILVVYIIYGVAYQGEEKLLKVSPFILSIPVAYSLVTKKILNIFYVYILLLAILFFILIFLDIDLLLRSIFNGSRGMYLVSPLNISSVGLISSLLCYGIYKSNPYKKIYAILALIFFMASLVGGSKGPMVAYFVSVLLLHSHFENNKYKVFFKMAIFIVGVLSVLLILSYNDILLAERLLGANNGNNEFSFNTRSFLYIESLNNIFDRYLFFGAGVDTFKNEFIGYRYPHNIFIELAYEVGFLIAVAFYLLTLYVFIRARLTSRHVITSTLLVYLIVESFFSHNLSFLKNILLLYFILIWLQTKGRWKYFDKRTLD